MCLCGVCSYVVILGLSVSIVLVPNVDAMTVMRVLLFVLDVCALRVLWC